MQGAPASTMPRQSKSKPKPADLTINPKARPDKSTEANSPDPKSSPMALEGIDLSSFGGDFGSLQPPEREREASRSFANAFKTRTASEPESREQKLQVRQIKDDDEYRPGSSSVSKIYHLRKNPGSTPELSLVGSAENVRKQSGEMNAAQVPDTRPNPSPQPSEDAISVRSRGGTRGFRNPLARSKSIRRDSSSKPNPSGKNSFDGPPKTASLAADWPGRSDTMHRLKSQDRRGKSTERAVASESDDNAPPPERASARDQEPGRFGKASKNVMSKAVSGGGHLLNRLGKIGRSGSSNEKEVPDSEYVIKVINLPLVEQARITRISKELGSCRDKTEFWMPSLPWRCIDYLNSNCEAEGLYRVPGSGPQVKHWQRRFDSEFDVDLLNVKDLYDPNTIASMLKSWLRDLPTEIMPKTVQQQLAEDLSEENPDYQRLGQPVSPKLRDALSLLPPYNYYLLFAITCHLSLLLSHKDQNKMDLNNLSICIGPCLDLERWLFNYLVGDWKHCWQGCYTEKDALENERVNEQSRKPSMASVSGREKTAQNGVKGTGGDERTVYSSSSARSRSRERSRQGSKYPDARSGQASPQRNMENKKPGTRSQQPNSRQSRQVRREPSSQDLKRPSTAGKQSETSSDSGTPKQQAHGRSQSDYQLSPVQPSSPVELPFTLRGQ